MARKILNRKELRQEADMAERAEGQEEAAATPAKEPKAPAKRKSRAKVAKEVRLKAFWGVFNQTLRRISLFEYSRAMRPTKKLPS